MRPAPLLGSLLTVLACSTFPATQVLVDIDADSISRARARELHVKVVSEDGTIRREATPKLFGDPPQLSLPTTVPVIPMDGDSTRTFTVFAELIDQKKVAFNKNAARLSFVEHTLVDVEFYFSDLCIGIDCPTGQTCSDGTCVAITSPPHGPTGSVASDAQPAYCEGPLCWEEPRPGGQNLITACAWAPDAGMAIGNGRALVLGGGVWFSELLPPSSYVGSSACWSDGEAIVTRLNDLVERSASGWKTIDLGGTALHGVWGLTSSDVWVVGDGGGIWRRKSHGPWAKVSSGVATNLTGVFGLAANDIYVVGEQSTLLHYDGKAFTAVPGPAAASPVFAQVTGTSKSDLAIRAGKSVWTFDGKAWTEFAPSLGVVSLAGDPSGLLIAGGTRGEAHFRSKPGAPWQGSPIAYPFSGPALAAVAVSGSSAIVGGDAGSLSHWSGSAWDSSVAWLTLSFLHGIANDPDDAAHATAVGDGGTILERIGEGLWRRRVLGQGAVVKTANLQEVWMGHGLFVAVGDGGTIAESTSGYDWSVVPSGTTQNLVAITSAGDKVVAGGAAGTLLVRGASGWSPFAPSIPTLSDLSVVRGAADGSLFAGAEDGSVWKLAPGGSWTQLGALATAVTDLGLESGGGLWACAQGAYHLEAGAFTKVDVGAGVVPYRFVIEGSTPSWIGTTGQLLQRQPDGTYAKAGPAPGAMSLAANGRFFMAGASGSVLAQRLP